MKEIIEKTHVSEKFKSNLYESKDIVITVLTYSCINFSACCNAMPFLLNAEIAERCKYEGTDIHRNVWQRGHETGLLDVELENIGEILRQIGDHRKVAPVVTDL